MMGKWILINLPAPSGQGCTAQRRCPGRRPWSLMVRTGRVSASLMLSASAPTRCYLRNRPKDPDGRLLAPLRPDREIEPVEFRHKQSCSGAGSRRDAGETFVGITVLLHNVDEAL